MYLSNITTSSLNAWRVLAISKTKFQLMNWIVKPILSLLASLTFCYFLSSKIVLNNIVLEMIFKLSIIILAYLCLLGLFGIVSIKKYHLKHT